MSERWLSVDEIAHHLGVSKVSIYKWCEAGKMPTHKIGRQLKFKVSEVDQWVTCGGAASVPKGGTNVYSPIFPRDAR
ncbi:MAG: helix-turn-helix domain-containing protein [Bdellovibrionales bacterium]|nr:helix-turn-helix domain-containing protein [Bdellovibrionales bacterium]